MKPPGRLYKGTNIHGDDFLRTNTGKLRDISFLLDSLMWWGRYPPDSDGVPGLPLGLSLTFFLKF